MTRSAALVVPGRLESPDRRLHLRSADRRGVAREGLDRAGPFAGRELSATDDVGAGAGGEVFERHSGGHDHRDRQSGAVARCRTSSNVTARGSASWRWCTCPSPRMSGSRRTMPRRFAAAERRAFACAARVVVTGRATLSLIGEYGLPPSRVVVIEPGTDPAPVATGSSGVARAAAVGGDAQSRQGARRSAGGAGGGAVAQLATDLCGERDSTPPDSGPYSGHHSRTRDGGSRRRSRASSTRDALAELLRPVRRLRAGDVAGDVRHGGR